MFLRLTVSLLTAGDAGRDEVNGGAVRHQDPEERRCDPR